MGSGPEDPRSISALMPNRAEIACITANSVA
jgi:hypothetical protein